jgi:hypothetical protein
MIFSEFLREDGEAGCVSAGNVAGTRGSLFGMITRDGSAAKKGKKRRLKTFFESVVKSDEFSAEDVLSKLNGAEKENKLKDNSIAYGIEDAEGNITKVYIDKEQDEAFKRALGEYLDDDQTLDVAEILFNLRNSFNILFVEWPKLPEDEEVDNKLDNPEGAPEGDEGEMPPEGEPGTEGDIKPDDNTPQEIGQPEDSSSLLLKVIDMLKADADAKTAESNAKAKEAEAEQAKLSIQMSNIKVKNEEDMLRAEEHFKKQNDDKKEQERVAKLAKYRSEINNNATYEGAMSILDFMHSDLKDINEDINDDELRIQTQIADLNVRKNRAMKVYDDQVKRLQNQLLNINKQQQSAGGRPQGNPQQQQGQPQQQPQGQPPR